MTTDRLLRINEVLEIVGLSRSAWYAGVKAGQFPPPVRLTPRTAAWRESEVVALVKRAS